MTIGGRGAASFLVLCQFADLVRFENNKPKKKHTQEDRKWGGYYASPVIVIDEIATEKVGDAIED